MSEPEPQVSQKPTRLSPLLLQRAREMRKDPMPPEKKLWNMLRDRQLAGLKFRRQVPIGNFIADFYCASVKVIVELDGDSHDGRDGYDEERTCWLNTREIHVLRFTNDDVHRELDAVLLEIARVCGVEV